MRNFMVLGMCLFLIMGFGLVIAEENSTSPSFGGSGGGSGVKVFYIDDTFKIAWTDGVDNYEAEYKVWKIEEQQGENITIFTLVSGGGIAFHSLNGHVQYLGRNGKLIVEQIHVSGDDRWIAIKLENAEFKDDSDIPMSSGISGGGGSNDDNDCEEYYTCLDGSRVKYCEMEKREIEPSCVDSDSVGAGQVCSGGSVTYSCVCEDNPEDECPSTEEEGGSDEYDDSEVMNASSANSGGAGSVEKACAQGCNLNNTCVSVGFRINGTYCDISKDFLEQKDKELVCENNFECSSNICVDGECVDAGLIKRILTWFKNLFG